MTKKTHELGNDSRAEDLLRSSSTMELDFLKDERKAERHLAEAMATLTKHQRRLQRFQTRVEQSEQAVTDAQTVLLESQARRAMGPLPAHD